MIYITHEVLVLMLLLATMLGIYLGTHLGGWVARVYHHYFTPIIPHQLPPALRREIKSTHAQSLTLSSRVQAASIRRYLTNLTERLPGYRA
ncbi:hypothetical protein LCGC14_3104470 [marine sediment metagenome]|uniref:Uncharacterized protein n=1 Tax=marine sediment metagenome TaxID=412755 RepID=A0A0F8YWU9_9ZZZZ